MQGDRTAKTHAEKHDGSKKERPLTASSDDYWTERPSRKNSWAIISVAGKSSLLKLSGVGEWYPPSSLKTSPQGQWSLLNNN